MLKIKSQQQKLVNNDSYDIKYYLKSDWVIIEGISFISNNCILLLQQIIMKSDQNSFEEMKRGLEQELGITDLPAPLHPMNAYMRFFLERSSEERSKGQSDWQAITKSISEEWKSLEQKKRKHFENIAQIHTNQKNKLQQQYEILTKKRKPLAPYNRYIKNQYSKFAKQYENSTPAEINKKVTEAWKNISKKQKDKLQAEYQQEKADLTLDADPDRVSQYRERLARYHQTIREDKEKILKKYGINKANIAKAKKAQRQIARQKKRSERRLELAQKRQQIKQQKQKARQAKLQKNREEKQEQLRIKKQQTLKQKEALKQERERVRAEEAQKKQKEKQAEKAKKAKQAKSKKEPAEKSQPKKNDKKLKSKSKTAVSPRPKKTEEKIEKKTPKKLSKTKIIKKKAKPVKKVIKKAAKSKGQKPRAKSPAKTKGKGGKGKGAVRGKKSK